MIPYREEELPAVPVKVKLETVKAVRELFAGLGLAQAKHIVDALVDNHHIRPGMGEAEALAAVVDFVRKVRRQSTTITLDEIAATVVKERPTRVDTIIWSALGHVI